MDGLDKYIYEHSDTIIDMKIQIIEDNYLPDISSEIRERISIGRWSMYKIDYSKNTEIQYMLSTEIRDYLLNS